MGPLSALEHALVGETRDAAQATAVAFDGVSPHRALDAIFALLGLANQYIDHAAPWAEAKKGDHVRVATILGTALLVLEAVSALLWPVMPGIADQMRGQLGLKPLEPAVDKDLWPDQFPCRNAGEPLGAPSPLFPRIDKDREAAIVASLGLGSAIAPEELPKPAPAKHAGAKQDALPAESADVPGVLTIAFDDFGKVDLRVAVVLAAEKVQGKDKLLSLQIDLGEPAPRPLVAGIALHYKPQDLVGKRIIVVANLAPRKFGKDLVSHGMLLAAKSGDKLTLATTEADIPAGSRLS
jgi:methionyl-tRNA synthetase